MAELHIDNLKKNILLNVMEAQDLDGKGNVLEAYKMYLICLKSMADQLIIECHTLNFQVTEQDKQYISLCIMCSERLKVLSTNIKLQTPASFHSDLNTSYSFNSSGEILFSPLDEAKQYNKKLMQSHQEKLKIYSTTNKHLFLNLSLSLQRKMIENIQIAEKHKMAIDRIKERKYKQILDETEKRFQSTTISQEDEILRRKLYFDILQFESNHGWLQSIRNSEKNKFSDSMFVANLIENILRMMQHPYTQYMQGEQFKICFEVKEFCDAYDKPPSYPAIQNDQLKEAKLASVIGNVKSYFKNICKVFVLIYENLDNKNGYVLVESILDEYFYKGVWNSLKDLFRSVIENMKEKIRSVMMHYNSCNNFDSSKVGVGEKFKLIDDEGNVGGYGKLDVEPYKSAIDCILSIIHKNSLNSKIQCLVTFMHEVCNCIEKYYSNKHKEPPEIGADDLLPVLTYLLIRTNEPSIYVECYILMEFADESVLLGEEGYSLTSILTAFDWISKNNVCG